MGASSSASTQALYERVRPSLMLTLRRQLLHQAGHQGLQGGQALNAQLLDQRGHRQRGGGAAQRATAIWVRKQEEWEMP